MNLSLNIEFESLEEYLELSALLQKHFSTKALTSKTKVSKPTRKATKGKKPDKVTMPIVAGFKPPEDMIRKVNEYLRKGQAFRTKDVAGKAIMNNPNRRAKANKWLQSYPNLMFSHQKGESERGRGPLVYTPVRYEDGKMILPPGIKPAKTDWPIKGASYKSSYRAPIESPDDDHDLLESMEPSQRQSA